MQKLQKEEPTAQKSHRLPKAGTVALASAGYHLGEEMAPSKYAEMLARLRELDLEITPVDPVVLDIASARRAGEKLAEARVDFIYALLTTFVSDYYIIELLDACDAPIFLWAVEREIDCLSLVGGLLISPTLYELGKHYQLYGGDIGNPDIVGNLMIFARAAMMRQVLRNMRVGYMSENPNIMFSMVADEIGLKRVMGTTVMQLRDFDYLRYQEMISDDDARSDWETVRKSVGAVKVAEADGVAASKAFLAMTKMVEEMQLDALSINCIEDLKSRICLPIARINDEGIGAACEGDLYSTILMQLLFTLSGRSALNSDFLRMFPEKNQIMFSHCGAGPFSMARSRKDIVLHESIETRDGLAVFFPADQAGTVTALNLMGSRAGFRLAVMVGEVEPTDMVYQGNPMRVKFEKPVHEILQGAVKSGAGHHWNIGYGDFSHEFELLCKFLGIQFNLLSR